MIAVKSESEHDDPRCRALETASFPGSSQFSGQGNQSRGVCAKSRWILVSHSEHIVMNPEFGVLGGEKLTRYLQRCVELVQHNKISIKNAFDIHLIDQMIGFCRGIPFEAKQEERSFPLASLSLHASGKVYGFRVDSVEKEAFRLIIEHSGGGKRPAEEPSKETKKRRHSTYLADEEAINRPIDTDYSLCRNSIIEEITCNHSNAYGRLMSYNLIPPETQGIDLEGESPWWAGDHLEKVALKNRLPHIRKDLPILIECVELNVEMPTPINVKTEDDSFVFDPSADPMPELEEIAPVDINAYHFEDSCSEHFDEPLSDAPGVFSSVYSNSFKSTGTNFAGPHNFRLKRYDIFGVERKGKRSSCRTQKKELKYLSFDDFPADFGNYGPNLGMRTELRSATLMRWTKDAHVLKVDPAPSSFARLAELFAFPNRPIPADEPDDANESNEGNASGAIPGQSSNFSYETSYAPCGEEPVSDSGVGDDFFRGSDDFDDMEAEIEVPVRECVEDLRYDNLISAPGIVANLITVKYATEARKLSMKQIKESFWKALTNDAAAEKIDGEKSFADMYSKATPYLTDTNRRNMNLQIAFVATLSLCNQKHLILTPKEDSADFMLSQAAVPRESGETNLPPGRSRSREMVP